jgi:phosphatidylinositol alpha-mannosyltransferase
VLFVSRLEPRKGFMVALRAFEILQERVTDVRFVAAGDGSERTAVEQLPPAVRDKVLMLGSVPNDQLPRYHAAADVFVAPATGRESFGYILVEAMASGLPVVASRIPGYDEVVREGVDGLLVPPSNPPALATALERVLGDPDMARRFGESGRKRAGEFSWDRIAARLEPIYRRVA